MYRYFVSFKSRQHTGNTILERDARINTVAEVRTIEQILTEKFKLQDVQLLNFFVIHENDRPAVDTLELE